MSHRKRLFISHAKEDKTLIAPLMEELVSHGFELWLDRTYEETLPWPESHPIRKHVTSLRFGKVWHLELGKALNDADALVVFWSKRSVDQAKKPIILMEVAVHLFRGTAFQVYIDDAEPPQDVRSAHQFARLSEKGSFEALIRELILSTSKELPLANEAGLSFDKNDVRAYWEILQYTAGGEKCQLPTATCIPVSGSDSAFWISRHAENIKAGELKSLLEKTAHLRDSILHLNQCKAAFTPGNIDWGKNHPFGLEWSAGDGVYCRTDQGPRILRHGSDMLEPILQDSSASLWINRAR
ncbi:hypothetical protein ASG39_00035 [Rhizobium sp. Leaf371]|uniref:toll/interleukin-1 receptor domain-containing protein n=1 Tax=Rhizobium sp. Leaf371 TaxID=1736355 RepID=UPI0007130E02|nr:toll/interleukin-1 receptor domain-containing protein [Rhizobium sp. Leaf371]KQS72223.1 hypothetical protein ASG39_00035 [Rhizobium sp. Leaf371]